MYFSCLRERDIGYRVCMSLVDLFRSALVRVPRCPVSFMVLVSAEAVICVYSVSSEGTPRPASVFGSWMALVGKDLGSLQQSLTILSTALSITCMSVSEKGATIIGYLIVALTQCVMMRMH